MHALWQTTRITTPRGPAIQARGRAGRFTESRERETDLPWRESPGHGREPTSCTLARACDQLSRRQGTGCDTAACRPQARAVSVLPSVRTQRAREGEAPRRGRSLLLGLARQDGAPRFRQPMAACGAGDRPRRATRDSFDSFPTFRIGAGRMVRTAFVHNGARSAQSRGRAG